MTDHTKFPLTPENPADALLGQLREAAPHLFSEDRLDWEKLRATLGENLETGQERYGLTWAGKAEAFRNVQTASIGTLLPMPEASVNFDNSENLIIEGDNLEVLKLLQKSYHGKVKMIYIDPPYNTGNEFIYPDNYQDGLEDYLRYSGQRNEEGLKQTSNTETSGRFHSNWLSLMYPRLFLARNLLRDDGVIFVSIDDNEVHNLRLLMNEVFGEENFLATIIWKKSYGGGSKAKHVVGLHEYILAFCRNKNSIPSIELPPNPESIKYYKYKDNKFNTRGPYRTQPLATTSMDDRPNLRFPIPWQGEDIWPEKQWQWSYDRVISALEGDNLVIQKRGEKWVVDYKQYLKDEDGNVRGSKPFSVLDGPYTQKGTEELRSLLGKNKVFDFPKPTELIKHFIQYFDKNALVLDFFSGSGSTGQAVLDANSEDGGNRKFILVQLPEKTDNPDYPTIADITRERIRRVIKKLDQTDAGKLDLAGASGQDRGFRAFRLSSSNFKIWDGSKAAADTQQLMQQLELYANNVQNTRSPQDILFELLLKAGLPLSSKIEQQQIAGQTVYAIPAGKLLVCLEASVTQALLRGMIAENPQQILCLDTAFQGNDPLKTNMVLEARSHNILFRTV